jgi:hypothetical protein
MSYKKEKEIKNTAFFIALLFTLLAGYFLFKSWQNTFYTISNSNTKTFQK